jgi:sugar phosphate isomerase/epimerase
MAQQFKLGLVFGDGVPVEDVAPGYEYLEIPLGNLMIPFESDAIWKKRMATLKAQSALPMCVASHWFNDPPGKGPDAVHFWTRRALKRCAELGVEVAGVYGAFFPLPEGFSRKKATDQAVRYLAMTARHAEANHVLIALEPMADLSTLFPRYLEGIQLAKEVGSKSVRVMADLNYFLDLDQPLEDIAKEPEYCLHCHIQGDGGAQPNVAVGKRPSSACSPSFVTSATSAGCPPRTRGRARAVAPWTSSGRRPSPWST